MIISSLLLVPHPDASYVLTRAMLQDPFTCAHRASYCALMWASYRLSSTRARPWAEIPGRGSLLSDWHVGPGAGARG